MAKIVFYTQELKNALAKINPAIGAGKVNPAEKNIYIRKKDDNRIEFQAGSMYLSAQVACEVKGNAADFNEFSVEGKKIIAFVSKLTDEETTFDIGKTLHISTARADIKVPTINAAGKPIAVEEFNLISKIKYGEFKTAVAKAIVCTSKSETRPMMTAINFAQDGNAFELQTCDGTRLAVVRLGDGAENNFSYLVPAEAVAAIISMAGGLKEDGEIEFKQAGRSALFEFDGVEVRVNLITDQFIEVHKLLPTNYTKKINVDAAELKNALDIVSLATAENRTPLKVTVNGSVLKIATNSTVANCEITVPLAYSTITEDFIIGFNAALLAQVVKTFADDELALSFGEKTTGVLIEGENHTALVLPVRLRE